mgnify:CR=1 FL=1
MVLTKNIITNASRGAHLGAAKLHKEAGWCLKSTHYIRAADADSCSSYPVVFFILIGGKELPTTEKEERNLNVRTRTSHRRYLEAFQTFSRRRLRCHISGYGRNCKKVLQNTDRWKGNSGQMITQVQRSTPVAWHQPADCSNDHRVLFPLQRWVLV